MVRRVDPGALAGWAVRVKRGAVKLNAGDRAVASPRGRGDGRHRPPSAASPLDDRANVQRADVVASRRTSADHDDAGRVYRGQRGGDRVRLGRDDADRPRGGYQGAEEVRQRRRVVGDSVAYRAEVVDVDDRTLGLHVPQYLPLAG